LFLNNRHYDPSTGVFVSVDPLVTMTVQPYIYGAANPLTFSDPDGLEPRSIHCRRGCGDPRQPVSDPHGKQSDGYGDDDRVGSSPVSPVSVDVVDTDPNWSSDLSYTPTWFVQDSIIENDGLSELSGCYVVYCYDHLGTRIETLSTYVPFSPDSYLRVEATRRRSAWWAGFGVGAGPLSYYDVPEDQIRYDVPMFSAREVEFVTVVDAVLHGRTVSPEAFQNAYVGPTVTIDGQAVIFGRVGR